MLGHDGHVGYIYKFIQWGSLGPHFLCICSASVLNNDLLKSNIVFSPNCACGVLEKMHFIYSLNVVNTPIFGGISVLICLNRLRMKIYLAY
jgi:hypothetical protein